MARAQDQGRMVSVMSGSIAIGVPTLTPRTQAMTRCVGLTVLPTPPTLTVSRTELGVYDLTGLDLECRR